MNEITNQFCSQEINSWLKCIYDCQDLCIAFVNHLLKIKKIIQKLKKKNRKLKIYLSNGQFLFNMIWPMKLPRWKSADKVLHDKSFDIAKNSKYDGYQHGLASMVMQLHVHRQRP